MLNKRDSIFLWIVGVIVILVVAFIIYSTLNSPQSQINDLGQEDNNQEYPKEIIDEDFGKFKFVPANPISDGPYKVYRAYYSSEENLATFHYEFTIYITDFDSTLNAQKRFDSDNLESEGLDSVDVRNLKLLQEDISLYSFETKLGVEGPGYFSGFSLIWVSDNYMITILNSLEEPTQKITDAFSDSDSRNLVEEYLRMYPKTYK